MEPTNVLIRVCILLLMQPAPLAGTATSLCVQILRATLMQPAPLAGTATVKLLHCCTPFIDATRTPRGDGNVRPVWIADHGIISRCNLRPPTGTATSVPFGRYWGIAVDAARAPHGDGNSVMKLFFLRTTPMQPAPLTGTATPTRSGSQETSSFDATRTPYGDGNLAVRITLRVLGMRCNPHPLRGRQLVL